MVAAVVVALTASEQDMLTSCEERISRGLLTFAEVGQALMDIRRNRLFRATHATFEEYALDRWGLREANALRHIDAAQVHQLISHPIGPGDQQEVPAPANESQARPLAKLLPHPMADPETKAAAEEQIRQVWSEAVASAPRTDAGEPKVTARHVEKVVNDHLADESAAPQRKPATRKPLPDAARDAGYDLQKAAERVARIVADDRFPRNAEQVATQLRHHLYQSIEALSEALNKLPNTHREFTE